MNIWGYVLNIRVSGVFASRFGVGRDAPLMLFYDVPDNRSVRRGHLGELHADAFGFSLAAPAHHACDLHLPAYLEKT